MKFLERGFVLCPLYTNSGQPVYPTLYGIYAFTTTIRNPQGYLQWNDPLFAGTYFRRLTGLDPYWLVTCQ